MLTLTPTAAEAVRALVAGMDVDDAGGLRISSGEPTQESAGLELAMVDAPEVSDAQIEAGGANVFLEPLVAGLLDDKVLDASVESGRVRFEVLDRGLHDAGANGVPPA